MNTTPIDIFDALDTTTILSDIPEYTSSYETLSFQYIPTIPTTYELIEFSYPLKIENNIPEIDKVIKKPYSILSGGLFIGKYILTSSLIFAILLAATNYSAYYNIAKSYVFSGQAEATTQGLINSVEAANIQDKYTEDEILEKENNIESVQDKNTFSMRVMKKNQDKEGIPLNIEMTPYSNRIIIPKIGKNIPLIEIKDQKVESQKALNDIFMTELEQGIVRYPSSAQPGEKGNSFIFGHSSNFPWMKGEYNDVFSNLDQIVFDDEIIVYYEQKKYTYKIREKKVISPGDVSILKRNNNKKEITLMTCWPIGTTLNRLIVTGELVE